MAHKPEASGSFDGIFTLPTRDQAEQLSMAVKGIIDASVDLFFTIDSDPHVKTDLEADLVNMKHLLALFPPMCFSEETKNKAKNVVVSISGAADNILVVFREHVSGKLDREQEGKVRANLQKIMFHLITVTDQMEDLQRTRCLMMVSNSFRHLQIFRDTVNDIHLKEKLSAYIRDMKQLLNTLRARRDVLAGPDSDEMERLATDLEAIIPLLTRSIQAFVQNPSQENTQERDTHIRTQANVFKEVLQSLNTYQASGSFDYTSLSEAMDLLERAIEEGDRDSAVAQAREISDAIRNRPDFGVDRLNDLLRQMVQLTKDGLNNPEENQEQLASVLNGMKTEVLTVQSKHAKSGSNQASRMDSLLQCAQTLSSGLQELETSLQM